MSDALVKRLFDHTQVAAAFLLIGLVICAITRDWIGFLLFSFMEMSIFLTILFANFWKETK